MYHLIYHVYNDESIKFDNKYNDLFCKILDYVPHYLVSNETAYLFEKIFEEIPTNITKKETKRIVREQCVSLFHLDGDKKDFYFEDVDTKEIVIVTQYY